MKTLLTLFLTMVLIATTRAQMVGADAYMKGNYVEVGVNGLLGYEGVNTTVSPVMPGMHMRGAPSLFGFVANPQMDGWINFDGDFYTPGSPENGWGIRIFDTTGTDTAIIDINNNLAFGDSVLTGSITSYTYTAGYTTVVWEGNYGLLGYDLDITIKYDLYDPDLFYTTTVTIVNNGPSTIEAIYYLRNIDPDNNQSINSDFTTTNTIVSQKYFGDAHTSVTATQSSPWLSTCAFFSADTTARVSVGGFSNRDASVIWDYAASDMTPGFTNMADEAISIVFKGENVLSFTRAQPLTFTYQTVFSAAALTQLSNTLGMQESSSFTMELFPNPFTNLIQMNSNEVIDEVAVYDALGKLVLANTPNTPKVIINSNGWPNGVYIVEAKSASGIARKKVVKQ